MTMYYKVKRGNFCEDFYGLDTALEYIKYQIEHGCKEIITIQEVNEQ